MKSKTEIISRIEETYKDDEEVLKMYKDGEISFEQMYNTHCENANQRIALRWVLG